jgi:tetratricopeptide (TPR) repeat protein
MEDAIKLLDSIQKSDAQFMCAEILMLLGDRLFSNTHKDYQSALDFYKKACFLMPTSEVCHTKVGLAFEKIREFDLAIDSYKKALRRNSKAFTPLLRLGLTFIRNNQKEKGLKQLLLAYE